MQRMSSSIEKDISKSKYYSSIAKTPSTIGIPRNSAPKFISNICKKETIGPKMDMSLSRSDSIKPKFVLEDFESLFNHEIEEPVSSRRKTKVRTIKTSSPPKNIELTSISASSILKKRTFKTESKNASNSPDSRERS